MIYFLFQFKQEHRSEKKKNPSYAGLIVRQQQIWVPSFWAEALQAHATL